MAEGVGEEVAPGDLPRQGVGRPWSGGGRGRPAPYAGADVPSAGRSRDATWHPGRGSRAAWHSRRPLRSLASASPRQACRAASRRRCAASAGSGSCGAAIRSSACSQSTEPARTAGRRIVYAVVEPGPIEGAEHPNGPPEGVAQRPRRHGVRGAGPPERDAGAGQGLLDRLVRTRPYGAKSALTWTVAAPQRLGDPR